MPASGTRELYLSTSVHELNQLADKNLPPVNNARLSAKAAQSLFVQAEKTFSEGDEEKAYVLFMKYFNLIQGIKKTAEYKKNKQYYDDLMGAKNCLTAIEKAEKLGGSLKTRYEEREAVEVSKKLSKLDSEEKKDEQVGVDGEVSNGETAAETKPSVTASDAETSEKEKKFLDAAAPPGGVTVQALYRLLCESTVSVLLMDVRSRDDFTASHIKTTDSLSVPADCLPPGSTVNLIEKRLPVESLVQWRHRASVDYIILVDWNASATKLDPRGPVACLKDALYKWDMETVLTHEPLVLEGGYKEWLLCYPTQTTNPSVTVPAHLNSTANHSSAAPSLDSFDYDVDLAFLAITPKEVAVDNNTVAPAVGPQPNTTAPAGLGGPRQPGAIPTVDRSTKPVSQPQAGMNNSVGGVTVNGQKPADIGRINNQLNDVIPDVVPKNTNILPKVNNIPSGVSNIAPPPADRSKKPVGRPSSEIDAQSASEKKPSLGGADGEAKAESAKLEKEWLELNSLQAKKAQEASDLADIMRKKKKVPTATLR